MPTKRRIFLEYLLATLIGFVAASYFLPWSTLAGAGVFAFPDGDLTLNVTGHLAFQRPGWHWPLLKAPALAWPGGQSIALTDSNPALSLLAKLMAPLAGHAVNLMGVWLASCFILQPVAAVYALRGVADGRPTRHAANGVAAAIAVSLLSLMLPAFLFRFIHINLLGQFILLAALGYGARLCRRSAAIPFWPVFARLAAAVMVHPYLFMFSVAALFAPVAQSVITRSPAARENARIFFLAALLGSGLFIALSGLSGAGGGPGFGLYSMNLLAPFWPQYSGVFGPHLPLLDATGFQHEGFNYLGFGLLILLAAAAPGVLRMPADEKARLWRERAGEITVLLGLGALAVTPDLSFGHHALLHAPIPVLDRAFSVVRASGRAIWVVDYALIILSIGFLRDRIAPRIFVPFLVCIVWLQWIDTAPLRAAARGYFAGAGQSAPALRLPPRLRLFSVIPFCGPEEVVADQYRLLALRAGADLVRTREAHPATDAQCAAALASGLTEPLAPGEARLFLPSVRASLHPAQLGAAAQCGGQPVGLLCYAPAGR